MRFPAKSFVSVGKRTINSLRRAWGRLSEEMIFEPYLKGWVRFHQADRREGKRIPSRGNSMCKSSLKHVAKFFLPSLERTNISCTDVEFGFFSHDYIAIFKYRA